MPIKGASTHESSQPNKNASKSGLVFWISAGVLVMSLCMMQWYCFQFRSSKSVTFDETVYLNVGLQIFREGDYSQLNELGIAPLPIASYFYPSLRYAGETIGNPWLGRVGDYQPITQARLLYSVLIGIPLVLLVSLWLWIRQGPVIGSTAGVLLSFSPSILAHCSVATTDACFVFTMLLFLAAAAWYLQNPTYAKAIFVGCSAGLCIGAKYSGLLVVPILAVVFCWQIHLHRHQPKKVRFPAAAAHLLLIAAFAYVTLFVLFDFDVNGPVAGIRSQFRHASEGDSAYLLGKLSKTGWWYYFPVALFCKSTIVELVLAVTFVVLFWMRIKTYKHERFDTSRLIWLFTLISFGAILLFSSLNLGHRYALLVYPLLILLSLDGLANSLRSKPVVLGFLCGLLCLGQIQAAALQGPNWISYFNPLVGGPPAGHQYLLDSNLDWGQDLPALKTKLDSFPAEHVALDYFGTADPGDYGLRVYAYRAIPQQAWNQLDYLCVSVTQLYEVYQKHPYYSDLRKLPPVARAGNSIWIYDMKNPAVRKALRINE